MKYNQVKYIQLLSSTLKQFKKVDDNTYNFRCVVCGDSKKSKLKSRGYLISGKNGFFYHCHNCNASMNFSNFLKYLNYSLFTEYIYENFKEKKKDFNKKQVKLPEVILDPKKKIFGNLDKISHLSSDHPARKYLEDRKIPEQFFSSLYYTETFKAFTNSVIPNKYETIFIDEKRIIIPLLNSFGKVYGFQGRAIDDIENRLRYITILLDKKYPRLFGLDRVNFNIKYYVTEGPFDSLFLPNAIATCGGSIIHELTKHAAVLDNAVVVYDNEPRNANICNGIKKAINKNLKVVIWPENLKEKDINKMVLNDVDYQAIIDANTYSGLKAQLFLDKWRKTNGNKNHETPNLRQMQKEGRG
jgi:transcription elongation factor Elf1